MKDLFFEELRNAIREIREDEKTDDEKYIVKPEAKLLIYTLDIILAYNEIARFEGLLGLDEYLSEIETTPKTRCLKETLMYVVDGYDVEEIEEHGIRLYCTSMGSKYEALSNLMILEGSLLIRQGYNPRVLEERLSTLIPCEILAEKDKLRADYQKNGCEGMPAIPEGKVDDRDFIEAICDEESSVVSGDDYYDIVKLTDYVIQECDDGSVQSLLRYIDNRDLGSALVALDGKTRRRIFDNLSPRLGNMIAIDMWMTGPVELDRAGEAVEKILGTFVKFIDAGEIRLPDSEIISEMRILLKNSKAAQEGDIEAQRIVENSENTLYELWQNYLRRSNKVLYLKNLPKCYR